MPKSYVKLERGERVDAPDAQALAVTSQLAGDAQAADLILLGVQSSDVTAPPGPGVLLRGFVASVPSGTIVRVTRDDGGPGAAMLAAVVDGVVVSGIWVEGGESSIDIDITSYASATYGVWIRAVLTDDAPRARPFWVPGVTPTERLRSVMTRRTEGWEVAIEAQAPGPEWTKIWDVAKGSMTLTDRRRYLFSGRQDAAVPYKLEDADWGGGNDRTSLFLGVASLERFAKAAMRQIQDIIGHARWTETPNAGNALTGADARSLKQLNDEKLARTGGTDSPMVGDLIPGTTATRSLGSTARRFLKLWGGNAADAAAVAFDAAGDILPEATSTRSLGATAKRWAKLWVSAIDIDGDILPEAIDTRSLGSITKRFLKLWVRNIYAEGEIFVTGNFYVLGASQVKEVQSDSIRTSSNPVGTPLSNTTYAPNVNKAWARIATDGGGGATLVEGYNVDGAGFSFPAADRLRITFLRPFTSTNYWIFGGGAAAMAEIHPATIALNFVDIYLRDNSTGAVVDLDGSIHSFGVGFQGLQ